MYKMKLISVLLIGLIVLPDSIIHVPIFPMGIANAHPIGTPSSFSHIVAIDPEQNHTMASDSTTHSTFVGARNAIECDACMYLANGLNQTVLHNPKVISFVTADVEQICQLLPSGVQQLCLSAAEQTAPILLNHLGNFIASEGCSDLGICHK
jgi:hypothetical protein